MRRFKYQSGELELPVFFPDATKGFVRAVDTNDLVGSKTQGVLVNTFHLYNQVGKRLFQKMGSVRKFMNWKGAVISDSGGFQVMSLIKNKIIKGEIINKGILYGVGKGKLKTFTPEESVRFQMLLKPDMVVVLDDFTPNSVDKNTAKQSVIRTLAWAKRCKDEFEMICKKKKLDESKRPYILGVVQGGDYSDLRKECLDGLTEIGFDGLGYGGWPLDDRGNFNYDVAQLIAENAPKDYFLYGLGIGKPDEIVALANMGYGIFDCVLPTRDARHGRLYVFNADSINQIDITKEKFYSFFTPNKQKYYYDNSSVSKACDCLLCSNYSRAYLAHLYREKETMAMRLSTVHNLRFYSLLMEKIRQCRKSE